MNNRHIIFVPGKNPKPPEQQHRNLLWRTLIEGVRRTDPSAVSDIDQHFDDFQLIAWNQLYYHTTKDISVDLPWIDTLIGKPGASEEDIQEANTWHRKLNRIFFNILDLFPLAIKLLPRPARLAAEEISRYFQNNNNIACEIRELLKQVLRPMLFDNSRILLIGHSLGSIIAYDTLWELSHLEKHHGKVDMFLTIGSPLGMNYVQHRLMGNNFAGVKHYPANIKHWVNISSEGDVVALDRIFADDFKQMLNLGIIESIEDHCQGIYNFYRNEDGLNFHRSYGYLVNPAVGKVITDWWQKPV